MRNVYGSEVDKMREIPGYSGYFATECGLILNSSGRVLSQYQQGAGYMYVSVKKNGATRYSSTRVHRLVASAFVSGRADGLEVNHIDGNKKNNSASNLEWTTRTENIRHSIATGLKPRKFSAAQIESMRLRSLGGEGTSNIAKTYGTTVRYVNAILGGDIYKDAPGKVFTAEESAIRRSRSGAKLSEQQVVKILKAWKLGAGKRELSSAYGVSYWAISSIVNGESWKWVNRE